jgi:hypothetical protein
MTIVQSDVDNIIKCIFICIVIIFVSKIKAPKKESVTKDKNEILLILYILIEYIVMDLADLVDLFHRR